MRRDSSRSSPLTFDLSVAIRRPPHVVFALLADIQDAEPIPRSATVRMVKDPAGPTTVGTRWHEWVKIAPFTWFHVESVVSAVEPPNRLAMDFHSMWLTGHLTYDIEPVAGGCVLHHRERVRPRSPAMAATAGRAGNATADPAPTRRHQGDPRGAVVATARRGSAR